MDIKEIKKMLVDEEIKWIELQFTSVVGQLHGIVLPSSRLNEDVIIKGCGKLDGSSIKGFSTIDESDLILMPDPDTFAIIPWSKTKTARLIGKVYWGYNKGRLERDPRYIAERAEAYAKDLGYVSYWGPEVEFFIFSRVNIDFENPMFRQGFSVSVQERETKSNSLSLRAKEGYYAIEPFDEILSIRHEISDVLKTYFNVEVEAHHHEVASAGQCEIDFKYSGLVRTADNVQTLKYVVRNVATKYGMVATFMPKPLYGDNGSGMHVHVSLWSSDGRNVFYDSNDEYAELSQLGRYFIGGLLEHAKALSAIVSPTTNSYKRLVPGYEAPVYLTWSRGNRSAAIRVPIYQKGIEQSKRIEYRPPDPAANPYLAFAAILAAGFDGIKKRIEPDDPIDRDIYHMSEHERKRLGIKELPRSLWDALNELESDKNFLYPIFTREILEAYIEIKRKEIIHVENYPTPVEYYMYFDV